MSPQTSLETIHEFLAQKRIAMIGVSREPGSFSVTLFQELLRCGYDVVPVNPHTPNVLGHPCFARVQERHPARQSRPPDHFSGSHRERRRRLCSSRHPPGLDAPGRGLRRIQPQSCHFLPRARDRRHRGSMPVHVSSRQRSSPSHSRFLPQDYRALPANKTRSLIIRSERYRGCPTLLAHFARGWGF